MLYLPQRQPEHNKKTSEKEEFFWKLKMIRSCYMFQKNFFFMFWIGWGFIFLSCEWVLIRMWWMKYHKFIIHENFFINLSTWKFIGWWILDEFHFHPPHTHTIFFRLNYVEIFPHLYIKCIVFSRDEKLIHFLAIVFNYLHP